MIDKRPTCSYDKGKATKSGKQGVQIMKTSRALVENRRNKIMNELAENGSVGVNEMAEMFKVTPITIRRDLQYLEDSKRLERVYGGANALPCNNREDLETESVKEKIARYAADLVEDGDSIFINTSSTALQMIRYIKNKRVSVITNNGKAIYMDHDPCVTIVLTGGELREAKGAMVGEFATHNLMRVSAKKSFLGCSGLSPESGMTTEILSEVHINELMFMRVTGESYILADHSKLGITSSFVSCPASQITNIITDDAAPQELLASLRSLGIKIHQVK